MERSQGALKSGSTANFHRPWARQIVLIFNTADKLNSWPKTIQFAFPKLQMANAVQSVVDIVMMVIWCFQPKITKQMYLAYSNQWVIEMNIQPD